MIEKFIEKRKPLRRHHVINYKRCKTFKEIFLIPMLFIIFILSSFLLITTRTKCEKKPVSTTRTSCVNKRFFCKFCRTIFCVSLMDCYINIYFCWFNKLVFSLALSCEQCTKVVDRSISKLSTKQSFLHEINFYVVLNARAEKGRLLGIRLYKIYYQNLGKKVWKITDECGIYFPS